MIHLLVTLIILLQGCSSKKVTVTNVSPAGKKNLVTHLKTRRAYSNVNLEIPQELCLDDLRPIDAGEDRTVSEKLIENTFERDVLVFNELPPEVQKVIRLSTGDLYTSVEFDVRVILSDDPSQPNQRSVKEYRYIPLVLDKNLNGQTWALDSWSFKRQDNQFKLEYADLSEYERNS